MKTLIVLMAIAACANAFAWREGPLRAMLIQIFQALGVLLAVGGGFAYWWDSSLQPGQKSATVMVSGIVMVVASVAGGWRSAEDDEGWR